MADISVADNPPFAAVVGDDPCEKKSTAVAEELEIGRLKINVWKSKLDAALIFV